MLHVLSNFRPSITSITSLPKPGVVTLVSLLVMLLIWLAANQWASKHLVSEAKSEASVAVSLRSNTISAGLNRQLALLDGLYAYVVAEPSERDLQENYIVFAEALSANAVGVRNIVTAPGGVMQLIYPVEGNESVLGYNPLLDARQNIREDVEWAIQNRRIVISGPDELVQGGVGIIARMPVFKNDQFWGLANIVLDLEPILASASLDLQSDNLSYAIREENGHVFFGTASLFDSDAVISRIDLPEGYWELAAAPDGGWVSSIQKELRVFQLAGMAFVGLLTGLVYLSNFRQNELEQAVKERTQEISKINRQLELELVERWEVEAGLRERESQYRSIYESVSDGLFINSLQGELVDFNPAAAHMHGYTVDEFRSIQPAQFIQTDSLVLFGDYIKLAGEGKEFRAQAVDIHKDGTPFHVEVYGVPFTYRGEPHSLAILRDITEQIEAYQRLEKRVEERTHELASLLNASQTLTSTLDVEALLGLILDQLKTIVDYEGASILGIDKDGFQLKVYKGPIPLSKLVSLPLLVQKTCPVDSLIKREPLIIENVSDALQILPETNGSHKNDALNTICSLMCVPLMVKDNMIGVLVLHHNIAGYFNKSQAALSVAFANQAAIAIENANLYKQAQSLAALEERQKLARELHDSVSQALYGIALGARTVGTILDRRSADDEELKRPANYILSLAEAGLAEMRALIFELRPESLELEGLVAALGKQAASVEARHQIEVATSFCEEPSIPIETKEALYRISQEAMQNIVKHARATRVEIRLSAGSGNIVLEIQDNGVGFDSNRSFPGHLGLLSMSERVEKTGGRLDISSSPGSGTVVSASIPG
jgi:PAS domain S-box-containing protein